MATGGNEGDLNPPVETSSSTEAPSTSVRTRDKRRSERAKVLKSRVKRLEKKLELYDRKIKQMMEAEVSLDEMDSDVSAYLQEDLLKRKFLKTWVELCDLLHISPEVQVGEASYTYQGTSYSAVNKRVERLLRVGEFPDYWDVLQLIQRANQKHNLNIVEKEQQSMARKVFVEVGELLKKQRLHTWIALFGSHLTDNINKDDDPALSNPILLETLDKSLAAGKKRLEQVYDEFADKQVMEGDETASSTGDEEIQSTDRTANATESTSKEANGEQIGSSRSNGEEEEEPGMVDTESVSNGSRESSDEEIEVDALSDSELVEKVLSESGKDEEGEEDGEETVGVAECEGPLNMLLGSDQREDSCDKEISLLSEDDDDCIIISD